MPRRPARSTSPMRRPPKALLDEVGPVDVYLANAGVGAGTDPVETPDAVWDTVLDVNLRAHITAAKLLLPGGWSAVRATSSRRRRRRGC